MRISCTNLDAVKSEYIYSRLALSTVCDLLSVLFKIIKCNSDYSVQNDESLPGHCRNERRVRKRDKKVRTDVILRRQQKMERGGQQ